MLSPELQTALGMMENSPPPWLVNMQVGRAPTSVLARPDLYLPDLFLLTSAVAQFLVIPLVCSGMGHLPGIQASRFPASMHPSLQAASLATIQVSISFDWGHFGDHLTV